jgi:hypothetical protein
MPCLPAAGVAHAYDNFQQGNYWSAALDLVGVLGNFKAGRKACFTAARELLVQGGWKRIDEIRENDYVWSCDENDPNGKLELKRVEEISRPRRSSARYGWRGRRSRPPASTPSGWRARAGRR